MKTLIFFIAVTFGAVEISAHPMEEINKCYERSLSYRGLCPDYDVLIRCFSKIDPVDDFERAQLKNVIENERMEKDKCRVICVYAETDKCLITYFNKKVEKTKDVCMEIVHARNCLVKLNSTCTQDVISFDIEVLDNDTALCEAGHYDDGPCSASKVRDCMLDVFTDVRKVHHEEDKEHYTYDYKCLATAVGAARTCLENLEKNCETAAMQRDIKFESDYLKEVCPRS